MEEICVGECKHFIFNTLLSFYFIRIWLCHTDGMMRYIDLGRTKYDITEGQQEFINIKKILLIFFLF